MVMSPPHITATNVSGGMVRRPFAEGYNLLIGDYWFRTVANHDVPIQIGSKDSLAERQDRAGSVYENVLDIGYAWSRTDVSGGEGLDWDPRQMALYQDQANLDQMRFFSSSGIDISRPRENGRQYVLRLSHEFKEWDYPFVALSDMGTSATYVYVADGVKIKQFSGLGSPDVLGEWSLPKTVRSLAVSPNDTIMATCKNGNAYVKGPLDVGFTKFYGDAGEKLFARGLWFMHGRFVMTTWDDVSSAILFQVDYDQETDQWKEKVIDTASSPYWSVVESGPAVVAAVGDGTVRTFTPDNEAGGNYDLTPRGRTTMPEGETPILLGSNASVLLIMTTSNTDKTAEIGDPPTVEPLQAVRVYQAEVLSSQYDYTAGQLRLRRTWFATTHEGLETRNMTQSRDEIYWFVREEIDGEFTEALWRFDLVTGGLSRVTTVPGRNLNGLVVFDSQAAGIDYETNEIMIVDRDRFVPMGWMIFPNITFGVNTDISWMATVMEAENLSTNYTQIELYRSTSPEAIMDWRHPSWIRERRLYADGNGGETPIQGISSPSMALQIRLYSQGAQKHSPELTRVAIRGIPTHRDMVLTVPVDISDYVTAPGRAPMRVPGLGDKIHRAVLSMVGHNVRAVLLKPSFMFDGIVNAVSEPVVYVPDRGSPSTYVYVELRGKRITQVSTTTSTGGIGVGMLGVVTVGLADMPEEKVS